MENNYLKYFELDPTLMRLLTFSLTYPFIWLASKLPMRILYFISYFLYLFVYYVFGYRKKIVFDNLKLAFPNKSEKERRSIAKRFFLHFTDLIVESIKSFSISETEIKKRYTYKNESVINNLIKEGKSIILLGAHQANWEWTINMPLFFDINCYYTYTKIQNPHFDKVIRNYRDKFGYQGCVTSEFSKNIRKRQAGNIQTMYLLLSDQSPQLQKARYWTNFFNVSVPVHIGGEILSKKYNFAVVNTNVTLVKRGYYQTEFELITKNPTDYKKYEITDKYIEMTQKHIEKQPEFYLWSHKRFKHRGKQEQY